MAVRSRIERLEQSSSTKPVTHHYISIEETERFIADAISRDISYEELLGELKQPLNSADYDCRVMYEFFEYWREQSIHQLVNKHGG